MSKSVGNVVRVNELLEQGHKGEVLRLALLSAQYRQPLAVHLLVHAINAALGNIGQTVELIEAPAPVTAGIAELGRRTPDVVILDVRRHSAADGEDAQRPLDVGGLGEVVIEAGRAGLDDVLGERIERFAALGGDRLDAGREVAQPAADDVAHRNAPRLSQNVETRELDGGQHAALAAGDQPGPGRTGRQPADGSDRAADFQGQAYVPEDSDALDVAFTRR